MAYLSFFRRLSIRSGLEKQPVMHSGHDGLVVMFSDGRTGGYVIEELLHLATAYNPSSMVRDLYRRPASCVTRSASKAVQADSER